MVQGFYEAQAEYEAKMADPFDGEDSMECDWDFIDEIEERMLEKETEDYLWH